MKTDIRRMINQKIFYTLLTFIFTVNIINAQEHKVRIAMVGNSITYGYGLSSPTTECYSAQLDLMLEEIYGDTCEILNCGVSARTMMRNAEKPIWTESLFKSALEFVPDICLILLGTNDSKPYRWDNWGDEFLGDYLAMIDTFKFRNPNTKFIACYPTPIWDGHPFGDTFSERHNDSVVVNCVMPAIDTVVEKTGAILVDFHTPFIDNIHLFPDELHPGTEGAKLMAEILYNKIMETGLIHQVEAGGAYVSYFEQTKSPVAVGSSAELKWATLFADSVFLDGTQVETQGSIDVTVEEGKIYTLTAKGAKNTSAFPLQLKTYMPEKSSLAISPLSSDYSQGESVVLKVTYMDQYENPIDENTSDITWSIIEGEGEFGKQTDTTIVFVPTVVGNVVIEAINGNLSGQKKLSVISLPLSVKTQNIQNIKIFPNPVNEMLFIQTDNLKNKDVKVEVFNLLGDKLLERDFNLTHQSASKLELNTSCLKQGIYIYSIYAGKQTSQGQFVKIH